MTLNQNGALAEWLWRVTQARFPFLHLLLTSQGGRILMGSARARSNRAGVSFLALH